MAKQAIESGAALQKLNAFTAASHRNQS